MVPGIYALKVYDTLGKEEMEILNDKG